MLNRMIALGIGLFLSLSSAHAQTVTQAQFEKAGSILIQLYANELREKGIILTSQPDWTSSTSNAYTVPGDHPKIGLNYYGGLVRKEQFTMDELMLTLCHEMGHVLGNRWSNDPTILAAEGEADYFATNDCFPKVLKIANWTQSNFSLPEMELDALTDRSVNPTQLRTLTAAYEMTLKLMMPVSFRSRDGQTLKLTGYGTPQCRLDTYLAGALNQKRPACWNGQ